MSELKWRLPTKDELNKMYENLYKKGIGGFADDLYWSSSEYDSNYAWSQYFANGFQLFYNKLDLLRVRAVRTFDSIHPRNYTIGELVDNEGLVFDIQDNKVFVCKTEDEAGTYTWYGAMGLFEEKEEKQMEQNKKWYRWMEVSENGDYWNKRAVVEVFNGGRCRYLSVAFDEDDTNFKAFINNDSYDSSLASFCREIEEPEYKPYDKITPELRYRLLKDGYLLNGDWIEGIDKVHEKSGIVMVDDNLYTLNELFTTYRFLDGGVIGELK